MAFNIMTFTIMTLRATLRTLVGSIKILYVATISIDTRFNEAQMYLSLSSLSIMALINVILSIMTLNIATITSTTISVITLRLTTLSITVVVCMLS